MSIRVAVACLATGMLLVVRLSPVVAQAAPGQGDQHGSDIGIGVNVGTLGIGVEVSKLLVSNVGLRVGGNFFSLNLNNKQQSNMTYSGTLKVQAFSGLLDLYPSARGSFHLTAGLMSDPAKVTATGVSTGGHFTINNNTYTAAQVGTLSATGQFGSMLPYFGLGFGTAASKHGGLSFTFDLGIAIGKPTIALTATGTSTNANLQHDLTAQVATTQTDLNKVPGYPMLALGLMYRF